METPLVTVVTPSYNQGCFIRATIESVLRQDYPCIEYIIMDGGSTDETASVVKEYASRLTFVSEKDRGQSHAINKGFQRGRGEIVAWLNSDDVFLDGAIARAVCAFREHPRAGAVYGEGYFMDRAGNLTRRFPHTQPFNLWRLANVSDYILQQTVFFRKSVVEEMGYLVEDLHYAMDWDILIKVAKKYPLHYVSAYMGCLREYGDTKTFTGGKQRIREIRRVLRSHTGSSVPLGWIVHGLETYTQLWCAGIERWVPSAWLRETLQMLVTDLASSVAGAIVQGAQGWFSDGWASRRVRYMLPAGEGTLKLEGSLPRTGWLEGQALEILCNGKAVGRFDLKAGPFLIETTLPTGGSGDALNIEIRASHSTVPAYTTGVADYRELAYLLNKIHWCGYEFLAPHEPSLPIPGKAQT